MKFRCRILFCISILLLMLSCASLESNIDITPENDILDLYVQEPEMILYEGPVLHIFFHALVARPETAFKSRHREHFLEWYVTAHEYRKILDEIYAGNYVLIDINEIYEVITTENRVMVAYKKPLVPEGKKPMILSIDDLSYYDIVKRYASVHKLVIDNKGNIAAWTDNEKGGELSYDLDVVTYLEEFIKKHPDFSVRGARGIIALTGFEGVLGYATHKINDAGYEEEKQKAIAVVNRLKQLGWRFASHSWGHPHLPDISIEQFIADAERWDREVRPILGGTNLYIYPYGEGVEGNEQKHRILREKNFNVFFGVGTGTVRTEGRGYIYFSRRNIDGVYFRVFRNRKDSLFNIENVFDPARPK